MRSSRSALPECPNQTIPSCRRLMSSESAWRVRSTNVLDTEDFDVERSSASTCLPTGSRVRS